MRDFGRMWLSLNSNTQLFSPCILLEKVIRTMQTVLDDLDVWLIFIMRLAICPSVVEMDWSVVGQLSFPVGSIVREVQRSPSSVCIRTLGFGAVITGLSDLSSTSPNAAEITRLVFVIRGYNLSSKVKLVRP